MAKQVIEGLKAYAKKPIQYFYTGSKAALLFNPEGQKFTKFGTLTVNEIKSGNLVDYDPTKGFTGTSNVSSKWVEYPCRFDRYNHINIDGIEAFGNMLAGGTNVIDNVLSDFYDRTLPVEFDSVVLSTWAKECPEHNKTKLLAKPKSFISLLNQIHKKLANSNYTGNAYVFASSSAYADIQTELAKSGLLVNASLVVAAPAGKYLNNGLYEDTVEVNIDVVKYNNLIIVEVPDERMYSDYTINDGTTLSQEGGGVTPTPESERIYLEVIPTKNAAFCGFQHSTSQILVPSGFAYTQQDLRDMKQWKDEILSNGFYGTVGINQRANAFQADTRVKYDGHLFNANKNSVFVYTTDHEGLPDEDPVAG